MEQIIFLAKICATIGGYSFPFVIPVLVTAVYVQLKKRIVSKICMVIISLCIILLYGPIVTKIM